MALRAAQNAVDAGNRLARQPLGLKRRIVHERIAEPPRRLIREHIKVAALIRAGRPPLRHFVGDVGPEVRALRIGHLHAVDVDERLEQLLFGELPHVAGIGRHLALQVVDVVGDERAEELVLHRVELTAKARAAAGAPEHAAHLRMLRQIALDAFADVVPQEFATDLLEVRRELAVLRKQFVIEIGTPALQPRFHAVGVVEVRLDPPGRFHIALLGGESAAGLLERRGILAADASHFVLRHEVHLHAALLHRAFHGLHDHVFGGRGEDEGDRVALLRNTEAATLEPDLVSRERTDVRQHLLHRRRWLEVRRKPRLRVHDSRPFGGRLTGSAGRGREYQRGEREHACFRGPIGHTIDRESRVSAPRCQAAPLHFVSSCGRGRAATNACTSTSSTSDNSFTLYGGISLRGLRIARANAASGSGFGPRRGPVDAPCASRPWH